MQPGQHGENHSVGVEEVGVREHLEEHSTMGKEEFRGDLHVWLGVSAGDIVVPAIPLLQSASPAAYLLLWVWPVWH